MPIGLTIFTHIIGVDPGVVTGLGRWSGSKITDAFQTDIFEAYDWITNWNESQSGLLVILEDARLNTRSKDESSDPRKEGAGWVKYLTGEFERMLVKEKIPYILKKPVPKMKPEIFHSITGIKTLEKESHIRDAVMMIYNHPISIFYHQPPRPPKR